MINKTSFGNLIQFTRASSGSYWTENGIIIEVGENEPRFEYDSSGSRQLGLLYEQTRENLVVDSRNMTTPNWSGDNVYHIATGFDGIAHSANRAKRNIQGESGNAISQDSISVVSGSKYCCTAYISKASTTAKILLSVSTDVNYGATFYLNTLTLENRYQPVEEFFFDDYGDWWRFGFSFFAGTSACNVNFYPEESLDDNYSIVDNIQLELGEKPSSPIISKTQFSSRNSSATYFDQNGILQHADVNEPRDNAYVYNGEKWVPRSLITEPQSTNDFIWSRNVNGWNNNSHNFEIYQDAEGLDGTLSASRIYADGTASSWIEDGTPIADDTSQHAGSIFVSKKSGTSRVRTFLFANQGTQDINANIEFNPQTGEILSTSATSGSASLHDYGDWWRVEAYVQNNATGNNNLKWLLYPDEDGGYGTMIFDGAQIETNTNWPTSVILTSGSAVTRQADSTTSSTTTRANDEIIVNDVSWYNPYEGTFIIEERSDARNNNEIILYENTNNRFLQKESDDRYATFDGTNFEPLGGSGTGDQFNKIAIAYKENNRRAVRNGVFQNEAPFSASAITEFRIGEPNDYSGHIRNVEYYPKQLKNSVLEEKTS